MTNEDWAAAEDDYMREERERLGGPPAPEEVAALLRGELSDSEAVRIRALCVYYPELTDVLLEATPPEEPLGMSREEVADAWKSVRSRLDHVEPRPATRGVVRTLLPLAAVLTVGFFAGFVARSMRSDAPRTFDAVHELHPIAVRRGGAELHPHPLPANEKNYLLVLMLGRETNVHRYRVEIADSRMTPARVIWRSAPIVRAGDRPLSIAVPRGFLDPGVYQLDLYGVDGVRQHLATYAVRVVP